MTLDYISIASGTYDKVSSFIGKYLSIMGRPVKLPCKFYQGSVLIPFLHIPPSCLFHQGGKWVVTFNGGNSFLDKVWEELVGYVQLLVAEEGLIRIDNDTSAASGRGGFN